MLKKYSLWGVVLLLLTVSTAMGHKADPNADLAKFYLYAAESITFGWDGFKTKGDSVVFPGPGAIGAGLNFDMKKTPSQATEGIKFKGPVFLGGDPTSTVIFPDASFRDNIQIVADSFFVDNQATIISGGNSWFTNPTPPTPPYITRIDIDKPVTDWDDGWYKNFRAEDFPLPADGNGSGTLTSGSYDKVTVDGYTVFDCGEDDGEFYINNLVIPLTGAPKITIKKKIDKICRIFVKNETINIGERFLLSPEDPKDRGKVLFYSTATVITTPEAWTPETAPTINASIVAPRAKVTMETFVNIGGQLLAREINFIGAFDASGFEYKPFIKSNINITPPEILYENVDNKPQYDTAITCELSSPISAGTGTDEKPNQASLDYEIILGSGEGFANNTTDMNIPVTLTGTLTFFAGEGLDKSIKKIPLTILNDTKWEPDETFQLKFTNPQSNIENYEINIGATNELIHTITIKDDDPKNSVPTDLALLNNTILEGEPGGTVIGTLTTTDDDAGDTHTYSITGGTNSDYFTTNGDKLVTTDKGAANIDYEVAPNSYTITVQTDDGIATFSKDVTIVVKPKNDNNAKGVVRELYSATENIDLQVNAADGVLKNATDADEPQLENRLEAILKAQAKHGTVTLGTDGSFKYVQDAGLEVVIDSFSYTITDKTTYDNIVHTNEDKIYWAVINIAPVDDNPPVAGTPDESVIYENEQVIIDVTSLISDGDDTPVTIAKGTKAPTQGTITVDASGKITYKHDGTKESPFSDSFEYVAVSGGETSAPATVSIKINPINDNVSVATPNSYSVEESGSITKNVQTDGTPDSDADEAVSENIVLAVLDQAPANHVGEFKLNPDGSFTYTNDGTPGTDQFTYKLTDDVTYSTNYPDKYKIVNTSNTVTVTINVSPQNSSTPTARDTIANVDENSSFEIDIAKLIDDADLLKSGLSPAEKLTITVPAATAEGNASMKTDDGTIIQYTHGQNDVTKEVFTDVITYTVTDGAGHTATGNVNVTINPKNDNAPVANDDVVTAYTAITMSIYPLKDNGNGGDDFDLDEKRIYTTLKLAPEDICIVTPPTNGTLVRVDDFTYTYTANPGYEGPDKFQYCIVDSITSGYIDPTVNLDSAWVNITVESMADDLPIPHDDEIVVDEGKTATVLKSGKNTVMDNDDGTNDGFAIDYVELVAGPGQEFGTVTLNADGTFSYTHDDSENFSDFFEYYLYAVNGKKSIIKGRVNITVNPKNDNTPVITPDTIRINEGESATIGIITDKDTDIDEGTKLLAVTTPKQAASYGTVSILEDGTVTYTHDGSESGNNDLFIVTITDSVGYDPTVKHEVDNPVVVIITAVNDNKPSGTDKEYRVDENGTLNITDSAKGILSDAVDLDGGTLAVTILSSPDYAVPATFKVNPNGTFFYEQNSAEKLVDQFTVTLSDGELDTTLTVTININPLNDELAFGTDETFATAEGATVDSTITLSGITDGDRNDTIPDPFGNTYRIELVAGKDVQHGTLTLNANGTFVYVNDGIGEFTEDSFTYVIIDSTTYHDSVHTSEEVTVTFTISDENDEVPVAAADTILVAEGETAVLLKNGEDNVTWNDTDGDANTVLTVSVPAGSEAKNGTITLDPAGTFTYVHDGSATVADSFYYVANDGVNNSAPALVYVQITAKPPVVESAEYFDKNADGIVDEVVITYNHDVDLDGSKFKLRWDVDNADITVGDPKTDGVNGNIVILDLTGSKQYRTSGKMTLTTVHNKDFGNVEVESSVTDKAAPVVSGVHYDAKVGTGTLAITLSEHMAGTYVQPFTLIKVEDKSEVILNLSNAFTNSGTTYSVEVPFSEQTFVKNDSIYITVSEKVADGLGNEQINPANIRQPIRTSNGVVSAAYFDTSSPADGKIDKISVKTALAISDTLLDSIAAKTGLFTLNADRQFEITGYEIFDDGTGFDILVTEKSETVNTAVSKSDFLKINMDIVHGSATLPADSFLISDSVAPIILKGTFGVTSGDTTMILEFSEPVKDPIGSPYGFYDSSNDSKFDMTLTFKESVSDVQKEFTVSGITIDYVVSGDSVRIESFGVGTVSDSANNEQDSTTVYAPIEVTMDYGIDIELLIFPQPLVMDVDSDDRKHPRALHKDMVAMYNLDANFSSFNGVAFIIEANGPLAMVGNSGKAQLFDQTGNAVSEELTMFFEPKTSGNMAGVAIWDGKNIAGRVVGRNSYLLVVEVSVQTDEGSKSRVIEKQFIKTVGVTF